MFVVGPKPVFAALETQIIFQLKRFACQWRLGGAAKHSLHIRTYIHIDKSVNISANTLYIVRLLPLFAHICYVYATGCVSVCVCVCDWQCLILCFATVNACLLANYYCYCCFCCWPRLRLADIWMQAWLTACNMLHTSFMQHATYTLFYANNIPHSTTLHCARHSPPLQKTVSQ